MKNLFFTILIGTFFCTQAQHDVTTYHFTENIGQLDSKVKYHSKIHVGDVYLEPNKFVFDMFSGDELDAFYKAKHDKKGRSVIADNERSKENILLKPFNKHAYSMTFIGANENPNILPSDQNEGYKNYFIGDDESKWVSGANSYRTIEYGNLYDNIDMEIYTVFERMKYDFIVKPGGDPNSIAVQYDNVESLNIVEGGLVIGLTTGDVKEMKPIAYQKIDGKRIDVPCKFKLNGNTLSFEIPNGYDVSEELIIDPTWVFSTLTGSASDNWGFTATYDTTGALYSGGIAFGNSYPTVGGSYQTSFVGGDIDIVISKFSPNGTTLLFSTYLGGTNNEMPHSLVNDSQNNLVVLASTGSGNFPTTGGCYDASFNSGINVTYSNGVQYNNGGDIALVKFNSTGTSLLASTFVGGSDNDGANESFVYNYADEVRGEVVVDNNDDIYVTTSTWSTDFPTTAGSYSQSSFGSQDAVAIRMTSDLTSMVWGTYLGGSIRDGGYSIRVAPNGEVYVCGGTESTDLATSAGVIGTAYQGGIADGYVARFNNANGALLDLSYLGTNDYDQSFILEVDGAGDVFVTGQSIGGYTVANAPYSVAGGTQFIHKMAPDFSSTDYSTVFGTGGGTAIDISLTAFLVDNCGNVYVSGWGGSTNNEGSTNGMPLTGDAEQSSTDGSDFYFFVLERDAQSILYGSFFGSASAAEHVDGGTSRFDKSGNVYQAVCAGCGGNNFPTTPGVWSTTNGSTNCNLGAIKFELDFQGVTASANVPPDITLCSAPFDVDFDAGANPPPNVFWDFGDGTGTSTLITPTYTYADTGTYNIMYIAIDSSTCNIRDTAYFDVTLIQPPQFDAQFNLPTVDPCTNPDSVLVQLSFTGSGADSLHWDMGNGVTFIDSTSIDYYYTNLGNYIITLQAWDFQCNNYASIEDTLEFITSYSAANAIPPNDTTLCSAPPFDFSFDAGVSPPPDVFWDFGDGSGTSTSLTPTYTYADTGTYTVMYIAIDSTTCNIADTVYFTVAMNQAAQFSAEFNLPTPEPCTEPDSMLVQLGFTGSGADSLFWDMGDGTTFSDDTIVNYYYQNQGQYIVSMTAWDFVCNNTSTFTDTVDFVISYSTAQAVVPPNIFLCESPFTVDFTAGANPPPNSYWDFGDGTGSSNQNDPSYTYADTGFYTVMYVAIDSTTCNVADSVYFSVQLDAAEQFSAVLGFEPPPPCGSDSLLVEMEFTGTGADSIIWDMGNGDVFNTNSVQYVYTEPGVYTVEMTAYDNVCNHVETISQTIPFAGNPNTEVIIPNVFTPNGDGENDELSFVNIDDTQDFSLKIYNRWGVKVFESSDATDHWDGKNKKGKDMDDAVYYFEIIFTDICSSEARVETGFVHLMR